MSTGFKLFAILALCALAVWWHVTAERPAANAGADLHAPSASTKGALSAKQERLLKNESFGRNAAAFQVEELGDLQCPHIRWESTLESAFDRAEREDKPVLVAFAVRTFGDPDSEFL